MVHLFFRFNKNKNITPIDIVLKGQQQQQLIDDTDFKGKCDDAANRCRKYKRLFFWSDASIKLISTILMTMTGIVGKFFGWGVGIGLGCLGAGLSIIPFIFSWPELREKYAGLRIEFQKLSTNQYMERQELYIILHTKMEGSSLASDVP